MSLVHPHKQDTELVEYCIRYTQATCVRLLTGIQHISGVYIRSNYIFDISSNLTDIKWTDIKAENMAWT